MLFSLVQVRVFIVVGLLCLTRLVFAMPALSGDALQHIRAYFASFDGGSRRDILLVEGESSQLYFPLSELYGLVDNESVMSFSKNVHGCNPCIPLSKIAIANFDEARGLASITIHPRYAPAQRIVTTLGDSEVQPLSYGAGFAASASLLMRHEERSDEEQYAIDADMGLSLGALGSLYGSVIHFKDGETIRGETFYEHYFEGGLVNFQLGDVTTHFDSFGSSVQLGGMRVRRAFEVAPEYNYRPYFKYLAEARLPGTLELFIDGQSIKREEYEQGRLSIENSMAGRGGELTLVLTDSIGNRRVIRESLFDTSNNLAPGVVDFDISYGAIREDENDYKGDYGSAWASVGLTNRWTQSLAYEGNDEFEQASTEVILAFGGHQLSVQGAWSNQQQLDLEGNAVTAQYAYDWGNIENWARFGVEYFDAERFGRFRSSSLTGSGTTVSLSAGMGRFYGGVSAFEIGDFTGGSVNFGFGEKNWFVEASAEYLETDDYLAVLSIGYRPAGRHKPRVRVAHGWERDNPSVGADISGSVPVGYDTLGYQLAATQDYDRTDTVDSRAGLSYRGEQVDVVANYSDVNSLARTSGRITTGFVISAHDAFLTSRAVEQAYATVLTNQRGVRVKGGGYERDTDRDGEASLPMPAFYESQISIDRKSLDRSDVLTRRNASARVAKGNYAAVDMPVTQSPMIIHILNNGVNDIFINGQPFIHNDFGAYITKYRPDEVNTLEVGGEKYEILLPLVTDELPIYEFDRESGSLSRISELFREHR